MKKLSTLLFASLAAISVFAQEAKPDSSASAPKSVGERAPWPVWIAFNSTKNIDVVGLRLTIPYGNCESVTGFDLGFFGRSRYFEGLQINLLRNDVEDVLSGFQIGLYNSAGRADMFGVQVGLFNEARSFSGLQVGLVNVCDYGYGFQVGIINRAESMYGFQAGGVNVIRESEFAFLPLLNIGFDQTTSVKF